MASFQPATSVGKGVASTAPMPSWPEVLSPQHRTRLLESLAHEWKRPVVTSTAVVILPAWTGTMVVVLEAPAPGGTKPTFDAEPSWPFELSPQQNTFPVESVAQDCTKPAAAPVAPDMPETEMGVSDVVRFERGIVARSVQKPPSWPFELSPQQLTVPVFITAQVWFVPASIETAFASPDTVTGVLELDPVMRPVLPS